MKGKSEALEEDLNFFHSVFLKPIRGLLQFSSLLRSALHFSIHTCFPEIFRKVSFFLLAISFTSITANATTYYVSAQGNDAANGTSPSTPWLSIAKVNATAFKPGDAILFNRGETFYGTITPSQSGSPGNFIVYGAYGSGALPVITGFTPIAGWISDGGGIYEYNCPTCQPNLNMVTFQDTLQPMGRWPKLGAPNEGYLTINSHAGFGSLTSTGLSGALNYVGGEVVSRKYAWIMDRARILTQSGATITCVPLPYPFGGIFYNFFDNHGFFIQNHVNTCTQLGEWAYDSPNKKIKMYFGGNSPSGYTVQASTIDNLVLIVHQNHIIFDNISFKGSNSRTFSLNYCDHIQINNCDIRFSGIDAIYANNGLTNNITINNCTVSNTNNNGITGNNATSWTITNNSFLNTGMVRGAGQNGDGQYEGMAYISDRSLVQYNTVKNTGYIGIQFQGSSLAIRNNYVDNFDVVKRDGGGIYSYGDIAKPGRSVIGNIVINGIGDNYGCGADLNNPFDQNVAGIYMDGGTRNVVIDSNTVANCSRLGFELNAPQNIQMKGNTSFNNGIDQINFTDMGLSGVVSPSGLTIKNNVFFARDSVQLILQVSFKSNYISSIGTIDSNYYCRPIFEPSNIDMTGYHVLLGLPYNEGGIADVVIGTERFKSLDMWQTYSSQDAHTHKSPKTITDIRDIKFEYNATSSNTTIGLGANYIDVQGKSYPGTITLAPYSSAVLIKSGPITNQPPKANAGPDQTIILPSNSINLLGSGTDPDGTISSYLWTKISGPAGSSITNIDSANTTVTGLTQGVYNFELKVTDNNGLTGKDTMRVNVNAAATIAAPPVANAGSDVTITLPDNTTSLAGSGSVANGTIVSYLWAKISGPSSGTITNANSASATASSLTQGVYKFELKVTDNNGATAKDTVQVTVNAASSVAVPPVANAGSDMTITLPDNTTSLTGSGSIADGTIVSYAWRRISGPTTYNIVNASSAVTDISGLVEGVYNFELKVTDNNGATAKDTVQVTVNAANYIAPPVADAGSDITITLPDNTTSLAGSGSVVNGAIVSYLWTKISGPPSGTITNANSASTTISSLAQGVYKFELKVTDNNGATAKDTVQVTVNAAANIAATPVANAGSDITITLPDNTTSLQGSGSVANGTIVSYLWTKISGPATYNIDNASSAVTDISRLAQGVYNFELEVTDNNGATGKDTVQVTVNAANYIAPPVANVGPVANAGPDQTITLPENTALLSGSGTDPDGTITSYSWKQISGPSLSGFVPSNSPVTIAIDLVKGAYEFELTVTNSLGAIGKDTALVVVGVAGPNLVQGNNIKIYPNPVVGMANLEINTAQANSRLLVIITNMQGQIVYKNELVSQENSIRDKINMSNLPNSTYAVTVFFGNQGRITAKIEKVD